MTLTQVGVISGHSTTQVGSAAFNAEAICELLDLFAACPVPGCAWCGAFALIRSSLPGPVNSVFW